MNKLKEIQSNIKKAIIYNKKDLEKLLTFELKIDLKKNLLMIKDLELNI